MRVTCPSILPQKYVGPYGGEYPSPYESRNSSHHIAGGSTMADSARSYSAEPGEGCVATADMPPAKSNVSGAIQRHVSQLMQLLSTNRFPSTWCGVWGLRFGVYSEGAGFRAYVFRATLLVRSSPHRYALYPQPHPGSSFRERGAPQPRLKQGSSSA